MPKKDTENKVNEDKNKPPKTVLPPVDSNSKKFIYKSREKKDD